VVVEGRRTNLDAELLQFAQGLLQRHPSIAQNPTTEKALRPFRELARPSTARQILPYERKARMGKSKKKGQTAYKAKGPTPESLPSKALRPPASPAAKKRRSVSDDTALDGDEELTNHISDTTRAVGKKVKLPNRSNNLLALLDESWSVAENRRNDVEDPDYYFI
ncbi:unnamed protein product, partial [Tilletia laevis]